MNAINVRNGKPLAHKVTVAATVLSRMKGALGMDSFGDGGALLLKPCNWIHTIGMKFPIDIVFLSSDGEVINVQENVRPNRFTPMVPGARCAMELPAGTVSLSGTAAGDRVEFS